ncbi:MAG: septum site-determining protein MinC [Gammaproteobacteria bacterium 39-13]|nr:septum site-determining protein MinC [Gammaproteobacteria bacterium]OJV87939.1 MAG: septum site-determining protein MinC [Gammaproteobacteria bacterium 39-13]
MSTQTTLSQANSVIALKGGMFTLTTIQLLDDDLQALSFVLDEKIKQAPNFFQYAPVILDVNRLCAQDEIINLSLLIQTIRSKKLIPIGIRGADKALKETAIQAGLAIFPEEKVIHQKKQSSTNDKLPSATVQTTEISATRAETTSNTTPTRLITQPVRSGQQIYAQGGDLIVLAAVSNGAELLADGHIHVYGSMRGRALAGVMGDQDAMIFCKSLEAELVSIAGQYRLSEDLKETCWKQSACISLQDSRLNIRSI